MSIMSSTHHYQSIHQVSRIYLEWFWRYFADNISSIFLKGHNSGKGHNLDEREKKNTCQLFFMINSYMKFQNPSMHGSKVMLCIKKHAM